MTFDEILRNDAVLDALYDMHFDECTPIQELAIPIIAQGRDLIGIAQTGTGKTAAYLLPVIDRMAEEGYPTDAINCLVIAPTRELAQQIDQQMEGFAYFMPVSSLAIYGGTNGEGYERQRRGLTQGADVVIATPGRLIAHLSMGYVDLSHVAFLILDEADRMLDMGFYDDIMQIVSHLPKERQTLLFSATMPPKIRTLASKILRNPAEIKLAVSKPAEKIRQQAVICHEPQKLPTLIRILSEEPFSRVLIFASSKQKVKELNFELKRRASSIKGKRAHVGVMHSDLEQAERDATMLAFRAGKINVLVATDIVARGIDIDDITLVINYDLPHDHEDYVHRVGRTARADSDGRAVTFVTQRDLGRFRRLEQFLEKEIERLPLDPDLGEAPNTGKTPRSEKRPKEPRRDKHSHRSSGRKPSKPKAEDPKPTTETANPEPSPTPADSAHPDAPTKPKRSKRPWHRKRKPKAGDDQK
ncbi:MAG: DEAD/DEAH box helicase [Bacteroidales bacterium]|nr:DEAD/DEAH box helicase [Bacteroidales bacterium]